MLKTVVAGCGAIAQTHIENLVRMPDAEITGLCDIIPERAKKTADKFSLPCKIYTDYITMLDEEKPDVLHVCTPHYLHCEMAAEAVRRGIHVYLEKPLGITLSDTEKLKKASVMRPDAKICVSFQNRFLKRNIALKTLIETGKTGKLLFAEGRVFWKREAPYYTDSRWRGRMSTEGGGVMINQAIHTLDLLLWYCGMPEYISAVTANHHLKEINDVEDTANIYFSFGNGAKGMFFATTAYYCDSPIYLKLVFDNMTAELRDNDLYIDGVSQNLSDSSENPEGKVYWGIGHQKLIESFYESIEAGTDTPVSIDEAEKSLRILLAAYESKGKNIYFTEDRS